MSIVNARLHEMSSPLLALRLLGEFATRSNYGLTPLAGMGILGSAMWAMNSWHDLHDNMMPAHHIRIQNLLRIRISGAARLCIFSTKEPPSARAERSVEYRRLGRTSRVPRAARFPTGRRITSLRASCAEASASLILRSLAPSIFCVCHNPQLIRTVSDRSTLRRCHQMHCTGTWPAST